MVDNLSQSKAKRFAEAQANVEPNLPVDTFANTLAEAECTKLGEKSGDMNADALVYHSLTATHLAQRTTLATGLHASGHVSGDERTEICRETRQYRD